MLKHDEYDADNNKFHVAMRNFYRNMYVMLYYFIYEIHSIKDNKIKLAVTYDSKLKRKKFRLLSNKWFVYYFIING